MTNDPDGTEKHVHRPQRYSTTLHTDGKEVPFQGWKCVTCGHYSLDGETWAASLVSLVKGGKA